MSMATLAQRLKGGAVPRYPAQGNPQGTGKTRATTGFSPGSPGSPENNNEAEESHGAARRCWLIKDAIGRSWSCTYNPVASRAEVMTLWPSAVWIWPGKQLLDGVDPTPGTTAAIFDLSLVRYPPNPATGAQSRNGRNVRARKY